MVIQYGHYFPLRERSELLLNIFSVRRGSCDFKDLTSNVPQQASVYSSEQVIIKQMTQNNKQNVLASLKVQRRGKGKCHILTFARKTGNKCSDLSELIRTYPVSSSCFKDSAR